MAGPISRWEQEARDLLKRRLAELDEERKRLERAAKQLDGSGDRGRRGRPPGASATAIPARPRRRRKRAGGTRADQALALIVKEPGASASEVAKSMKIEPNYLYRVLGDLEKEGKVKKEGRKYFPAG